MNSKKFNFNRNTSNAAPPAPSKPSNNQTNVNTNATKSNNQNNNNNDDDDDLLDISDTELIRASQVVESQLRFTNSNYHTTSNAMNIFSQFNTNDAGLMGPPSTLPPTTIYSSSHNVDPFSQLEDTRNELKHIKSENLIKDGEVKILRDKLKRTEQEMQRIRAEKADLVKKLQLQQEEAKRALQKQIELKELENQIKSQEVVELTMKYKVLESTVKKNPAKTVMSSTPAPTTANVLPSSTIMPSAIQNSQSMFDDAFSHNKKPMPPPTSQSNSANNNRKRLAPQMSTSSMSLSDNENENPVHENKRPNLVQNPVSKPLAAAQTSTPTTTTPVSRPPLSPFSNNSSIINQTKQAGSVKQAFNTPTIKSMNETLKKTPNSYKRQCKLNLKPLSSSFDLAKLDSHAKSKANEKIYKFIDLFSVSESILSEFNKTTTSTCDKSLITTNLNANNVCIQNISQQLNNLLEFISYKSETSTILNDLFSAQHLKTSTSSSSSSLATNSSLVLVIERVEFVSKQLNDELVKLIKYCLNVSLKDGLVITRPSNDCFRKLSHSQTKPASMISIVDLLCLSFDVCYSLFLFRAKFLHSQNELNNRKLNNKLIRSSVNYSQNQFIYSTLIKLKQDFFKLIVIFLKSINFSSAITNNNKSSSSSKNKESAKSETTSLSNSSTSYSTLKILNSIMDCFNHLIYLPVLNRLLEPDSILTIFYFSLIDNMHNIFRNNKFYKLIELGSEQKEMEHDAVTAGDDDAEDCSNEYEDDDEPCLFKLFYEKLIKYFGEIVYSLELNETNETVTASDDASDSNQQISIITTIVADDETLKTMSNDFSTDKVTTTTTTKLTSSKSQNDLLETLQSQTPLDDDWKQKFDFNTSNVNTNSCQLQDTTTSNTCIHLLQIQLLSNFIHYLHNYDLFASFEIKFINQSEHFRTCYARACNSSQCLCYKDLLLSFLILIDYQFNEKFISGAKLCVHNCFLSSISSYCLMSPALSNTKDDLKSGVAGGVDDLKTSLSSTNCDLNEKTNRYLFILIMRCCNALISVFNRTHHSCSSSSETSLDEKKAKFYESIRDDYRLKNFYCLYTLVDLNYDEFLSKSKSLAQLKTSKHELNHMYSSLNSLRNLFKTYMDDYFDLD